MVAIENYFAVVTKRRSKTDSDRGAEYDFTKRDINGKILERKTISKGQGIEEFVPYVAKIIRDKSHIEFLGVPIGEQREFTRLVLDYMMDLDNKKHREKLRND